MAPRSETGGATSLGPSHVALPAEVLRPRVVDVIADPDARPSFDEEFSRLFGEHFHRLFRYLDRLSGDADLAADVAQETFVRLYRRGAVPDAPGGWLVSVAMNLFRNAKTAKSRRFRLLTPDRGTRAHADPAPSPDELVEAGETKQRVRRALDRLAERDRQILLLQVEGYSYHEMAMTLGIREASIGTLLARAKRAFRESYGDGTDAPE